ncbi:MAG: helix-turn-helix transcriptional regulator [Oscillospiraceae bacterium]|nr:helix-turn-helix transcriptional regulator [Oscillospiraceae bacterium]
MRNEKEIRVFCENIRYLRKKNGLSEKEMAKKLGIGIKSLNSIESGYLPPRVTVDIIYAIYENFGILPKDIFYPIK